MPPRLSLWRRCRRRAYWLLSLGLLRLAAVLPLAWGCGLCSGLARLALRWRVKERGIARRNIARSLPLLSAPAVDSLLRESAIWLGRNLFLSLAAPRLLRHGRAIIEESPPGADTSCIGERLTGLAAAGRGVFVLTGHIGCWELAGGWLARTVAERGLGRLGVVTGTVHNPPVDRLLQARRRQMGLQVMPREQGAGPLVRFLRQGGVAAVLQDQRTRTRNLDVPFFGRPAPTPAGLAALALRYDIPVLPVVGVWDAERKVLVMRHLAPIFPAAFAAHDQVGFLTACNAALEEFIRRNPAQWVWFHERWHPQQV